MNPDQQTFTLRTEIPLVSLGRPFVRSSPIDNFQSFFIRCLATRDIVMLCFDKAAVGEGSKDDHSLVEGLIALGAIPVSSKPHCQLYAYLRLLQT